MALGSESAPFFGAAGAAATPPTPGGYEIERSLRFNSADSAYLDRTPSSAGNRKTWTWSGWVKLAAFADTSPHIFGTDNDNANRSGLLYDSDDGLQFYSRTSDVTNINVSTTAAFRDYSAWYHIVLAVDTTQSTPANVTKIYVNGVEQALTVSAGVQNALTQINNNVLHSIGRRLRFDDRYFNGYLADVHFIDGQALAPTAFGKFDDNGVWQPIEYAGTYGTNGFHLPFSDNSTAAALGTDAAGSNDWTVNNISVTPGAGNDSLFDSPTNGTQTDTGAGGEVSGNYCTLSPLDGWYKITTSNGNLEATGTSNRYGFRRGTLGSTSGKFYWECAVNGQNGASVGVCEINAPTRDALGDTLIETAYTNFAYGYSSGFQVFIDGSSVYTGSTVNNSDIFGVAVDLDNGKVWFSHNGVFQGSGTQDPSSNTGGYTPTNLSSGTPFFQDGAGSPVSTGVFNFGQRAFAYSAPTGFKALCTTNLPDPTIADGSTAMDVALWTGTNTSAERTISGLKFSPDLVWAKARTLAYSHNIYDTVRGTGEGLYTDSTQAESTNSPFGYISTFTSDGFTGTPGSTDNGFFNETNATYAAWTWDAGTSTVSNTDGTITSSVRANPSAGFSIVTATISGSGTIGHGLNAKPHMVFRKRTDNTSDWYVAVDTGEVEGYLLLNSTASISSGSQGLTSSVFTAAWLGNANEEWVNYCFAPVEGYSAFGSYTGNGSTDGPFVYTGFRPRWVMIKITNATDSWLLYDSVRSTYNVVDDFLQPNSSEAEATGNSNALDFLSNGFKLKGSVAGTNGNNNTYLYAAFAENPFKYARAR